MVRSNTSSRSSRWLLPIISPDVSTFVGAGVRPLSMFGCPSSLSASFGVLRQQSVHDFRPVTEARCLQSGEGVREVDQPTPRAEVQHAQSARRRQAQSTRDGDAGAIIHQDQVGAERAREGESLAFADVERVHAGSSMERTGVGDDKPHARSEPEPFQVAALAFEILERVRLEYLMRLQKLV
jgi:hypothetical protein